LTYRRLICQSLLVSSFQQKVRPLYIRRDVPASFHHGLHKKDQDKGMNTAAKRVAGARSACLSGVNEPRVRTGAEAIPFAAHRSSRLRVVPAPPLARPASGRGSTVGISAAREDAQSQSAAAEVGTNRLESLLLTSSVEFHLPLEKDVTALHNQTVLCIYLWKGGVAGAYFRSSGADGSGSDSPLLCPSLTGKFIIYSCLSIVEILPRNNRFTIWQLSAMMHLIIVTQRVSRNSSRRQMS
jgi:hypothetical protein